MSEQLIRCVENRTNGTYHGVPAVGSRARTSANDFINAFLVNGRIAL